jgi:hypothetical protein
VTSYVVDFGPSLGVAHDFVNIVAGLGHRPSGAGGTVTITEDTAGSLRRQPPGTDGSICDLREGGKRPVPYVRMGGYWYPVRAESDRPAIATRRRADGQPASQPVRVVVSVVIDMTGGQVEQYASRFGLPAEGGRLYTREIVEHVRGHVLTCVQDSPVLAQAGAGVSIKR